MKLWHAMCGRSEVQILVERVDTGLVSHEAMMTPQCGRSVVRALAVRMDTVFVAYALLCQSIHVHKSVDL